MGRYVTKTLLKDEVPVFETRLHRVIYVVPVLVMVVGAVVCFGNTLAGLVVIVLGALMLMARMLRRWASEFVVTNKRVVLKLGILSRTVLEMVIDRVESVDVRQGVIARVLGYGAVIIIGTGGSKDPFGMIARPIEFRRAVQSQQLAARD
jgi:uncharacterized membrane protein YdbT with pleckstrin-like domain